MYKLASLKLDAHKVETQERYLDHINQLLDEELSQLRALKSQILNGSPVKRKERSKGKGLFGYQLRATDVKTHGNEKLECKMSRSSISPFSESSNVDRKYLNPSGNGLTSFPNGFSTEKRVVPKGKAPFFQVSTDGSSLSWRLPKITKTINGRVEYTIQGATDKSMRENHKRLAKRHEGAKKLSGKLIKAQAKIQPDVSTFDSGYFQELRDGGLVAVQCAETREDTEKYGAEKARRIQTREDRFNSKNFHLACTREQSGYKSATNDEEECTFCACPALLHERSPINGGQSQDRKRAKKSQIESTFFPRIEGTNSANVTDHNAHAQQCEKCRKRLEAAGKELKATNKKAHTHQCATCSKRLETAELNRAAPSTASSNKTCNQKCSERKKTEPTADCLTGENLARSVTKENKETLVTKEVRRPMLEYTAYVDNEGWCYILPGAFTLQKRDYNIWSRTRQRPVSKSSNSRDVMCGTSFPKLVNDQKAE